MTAFMYEFCTLPGAARFYDSVMALCGLYREFLPIPFYETRYEDMVDNFSGRLQAICQFLDVAFVQEMTRPEERARSRVASTPSSGQVARGLYDG